MHIHPDLRALRSDDTPQRDAQAALFRAVKAWRERPHMAAVLADLDAFAAQGPLADCPALAGLFAPNGSDAGELAEEFSRVVSDAVSRSPLGHVPLRHFTDGTISTLLLARSGNVTLSLIALDGDGLAARPDPVTVDFSPSEVWECVLAGTARAERIERMFTGEKEALLDHRRVSLVPGDVVSRDASREALLVRAVEGRLVTLRLQRRQANAGTTREYSLADGRLVYQAAGNPQDSRTELIMALLGRMKREDAAPAFARIAREQGTASLRWQALRECLALDTAAGFGALTAIARAPDDELAPSAGALRAQLIEAHPMLAKVSVCPE